MDIIAVAHAAESAVGSASGSVSPVAAVVTSLGLNTKLFLAQLVNFGLLVIVLRYLLYKPLVAFMDERSKRIATGIANAARYEAKLKELESERQSVLKRADEEARVIVTQASTQAEQVKQQIKAEAEVAVAEIRARAEREVEQTKREMMNEVRTAAADLVVMAAAKVVGEHVSSAVNRRLAEQALKEV
jgi:F-type H+-transporting ATPase subunit b